jgi:PKD repeat protein
VGSDSIHPSAAGDTQVADQLMAFFKTDPTAASWFLRTTPVGSAPSVKVTASSATGVSPLTVTFTATATDNKAAISQYLWTYDDGDFSLAQNPSKTFYAPGTYEVHLTVTDTAGNAARMTINVTVTGKTGSAQTGTALNNSAGMIEALSSALGSPPAVSSSSAAALAASAPQQGNEPGWLANPGLGLWPVASGMSGQGHSAGDSYFSGATSKSAASDGLDDLGAVRV